MSHYDEWQALAARIRGLSKAAELHMTAYAAKSTDSFGRYKHTYAFSSGDNSKNLGIAAT